MNPYKEFYNNLETLVENIEAAFSGIFIKTKPFFSITAYKDSKKKIIEEKLSHLIEKSREVEEIIENFNEKYTYAEGEDIAIFLYYINENVTIGTILEKKPKFALILLEHEIFSNRLKENSRFLEELSNLDTEKVKIEDLLKEKTEEVNLQEETIEEEEPKPEIYIEREKPSEEVPSLEDLIQESIEEYEKKLSADYSDRLIEEKVKESREKEEEYLEPSVLEHIEKEFVKEIGPIAKLIFNRKITELNIDPNKLKTEDIVLLIQELAKEIRLEEKKEKFINETNDLL